MQNPSEIVVIGVMIFIGMMHHLWRQRSASSTPIADQPSPNEPFLWPSGTTLEALNEVIVVLPWTILGPTEGVGSVIQPSNPNAKIGFDLCADGKTYQSILILLATGDRLTLSKTSTATFRTEDGALGREIYLKVVSDTK